MCQTVYLFFMSIELCHKITCKFYFWHNICDSLLLCMITHKCVFITNISSTDFALSSSLSNNNLHFIHNAIEADIQPETLVLVLKFLARRSAKKMSPQLRGRALASSGCDVFNILRHCLLIHARNVCILYSLSKFFPLAREYHISSIVDKMSEILHKKRKEQLQCNIILSYIIYCFNISFAFRKIFLPGREENSVRTQLWQKPFCTFD